MAHEKSITIQRKDGKWVNISSIVNGQFDPSKAETMFRAGNREALAGESFSTSSAAVIAAKVRSKSFDK